MAAKKRGSKRATASQESPSSPPQTLPAGAGDKADDSPPVPADAGRAESRPGPPVAGIGASAGGLEAFKKFFTAMPPDSGIAFVLIPHLDPTHESLMVELLARHTPMPVVEVREGMPVEANHVYIIPPNKYMTSSGGGLRLTGPVERGGLQTSIDLFLRSLADDLLEKAVCIILSGTGSHGTLGLKAVKAGGGMAMVQDPKTAAYAQMPQSAIATGLADYVLPAEQMPEALIKYVQHRYINGGKAAEEIADGPDHLNQLLNLLHAQTKFDFHCYRKKMLARRVERRMGLTHFDQIADYLGFLREHPEEVKHLARDLLISVTNFFRDPEAFRTLELKVIAPLIQAKKPDAPLRVWVPGCATGEEPYAIAMLLLEHLAAAQKSGPLQIFATDVDEDALEIARLGFYPESISVDVTPERLAHFFTRVDESTFQVSKHMRETLTFAVQNLLADAPFSKLDLISCRNVLIYLEPEVQQKVITLLHFALNEGGFLLLGPSETIGRQIDLFEPVSKKWRIYRRIGPNQPGRVQFPITVRPEQRGPVRRLAEPGEARPVGFAELTHRLLLEEFAPAAVLINRKHEILYYFGPTTRYLDVPTGEPTQDLMILAREGLRTKLRVAVHKAIREGEPVLVTNVQVKRDGTSCPVTVTVKPVQSPRDAEGLLLIAFQDMPETSIPSGAAEPATEDAAVRQLEDELHATREDLQSTIEELESSNEELKASNEEMMSMNEELQSTNEELESSKEEMQSLNEELTTMNSQLQDKVEQLEAANNDIANLVNSTDVPILFLDTGCRIKRFTPAATRLFNVIGTDAGRPISDFAPKCPDPTLQHDIDQVLRTLAPQEKEVQTPDGSWWIRRITPYRTLGNQIEGVVLTFNDVTQIKKAGEWAQRLATVLLDSNDAVTVHDFDGQITAWNRGAERMYGYTETEALRMNARQIIPEELLPHALSLWARMSRGEAADGWETQRRSKDGRILEVWVTASLLRDELDRPVAIAKTERDVSEVKREISQRKELEWEVVEIANLEHTRIGQDLHDNVGQELTAVSLLVNSLLESVRKHSPEELKIGQKICRGLKKAIQKVRAISQGLVMVEIDAHGLAAALTELTGSIQGDSGLRFSCTCEESVSIESSMEATQLYYIAQEACVNALKHSQAKNIEIRLHATNDRVVLEIQDDGIGFVDQPGKSEGLGLRIMKNRAHVIGAQLTIEPVQPQGAVVTCILNKKDSRAEKTEEQNQDPDCR